MKYINIFEFIRNNGTILNDLQKTIVLSPKTNWGCVRCVCVCVLFNLHAILICRIFDMCVYVPFYAVICFFYRWKYSFNQTVPTDSIAEKSISFILPLSAVFFHSPKTADHKKKNNIQKHTIYRQFGTVCRLIRFRRVFAFSKALETSFRHNSIEMKCFGVHRVSMQTEWRTRFLFDCISEWNGSFFLQINFIITAKWSQQLTPHTHGSKQSIFRSTLQKLASERKKTDIANSTAFN